MSFILFKYIFFNKIFFYLISLTLNYDIDILNYIIDIIIYNYNISYIFNIYDLPFFSQIGVHTWGTPFLWNL